MAYPFSFHRLVIGGKIYGEDWNTSLAIATGGAASAVDTTLLTSIAGRVSSWFTGTGTNAPLFLSCSTLTFIKLNRLDTNGHYQDASQTHIYPTPIVGTSAGTQAPQLAEVITLRTAFERGLASRGRMYLPPVSGTTSLGTDGRMTTVVATRLASAGSVLVNSINAGYIAWTGFGDFNGRVSVVSNTREGAFHFVTSVKGGRVIDTVRSRRASLDEDYQNSAVAVTP